MPNPALTVGGTPLYPTGGLLDPSRPVYRPNDGSAGLLTQPKMDNLINNFAGGILNGYQVGATPDANGRYFTPIAPSGIYTANPNDPNIVTATPPATPGSAVTFRDMIEAKYGFGGPSSDADLFIAQSLSTKPGQATVWGGTLDDPYDPNSDIWKNFTGMLKRLDTTRRDYGGDGGGGGGG
jgi:hypothetical protein